MDRPTPSLSDPTQDHGRLPLTPLALAGIAGDTDGPDQDGGR